MKLAEALLLRGDAQKKLTTLRERIMRNALLQEGSTPHEDPNALLREAEGVIAELEALVVRINVANLSTTLPDSLAQRHALLQSAIAATQKEPDRYSAREIKWVAAIEVGKLQKQSDDLSRQIRELNTRIQETNWATEI
jgi:hypothetical protein